MHRDTRVTVADVLKGQVEACLEELSEHGADPAAVALYDALYALNEALGGEGGLGTVAAAARRLSVAVELGHPLSLPAREILAELSSSGLFSPKEAVTVLEEVYRTIGADPSDPDAATVLRDWVHGQDASRRVLERRLDALKFRVRRTEIFANVAVVAALLLGVGLFLSVFVGSGVTTDVESVREGVTLEEREE